MAISFSLVKCFSFFVAHALFLSLCAAYSFYRHTLAHTPQEGIPFVEVAVCWCVDDVERGGGALAGSGLRTVVLLIWEFLQRCDRAGPDCSLAWWPLLREKARRERVGCNVRERSIIARVAL